MKFGELRGTHCRACEHFGLELVLSLGKTPLANALLSAEAAVTAEPRYALDLAFCRNCSLVQLVEGVPPEKLFDEYLYLSSFSDAVLESAQRITSSMARIRGLGRSSLVIELASNDGYLLRHYHKLGIPVLGIDPARNVAEIAKNNHGIETIVEYFGQMLGDRLRREGRRADVVHANNVLAHVPDLNGFVAGIRLVLKDDGIASIEVPYVVDLVRKLEFDTIYHEHLCYFSLSALVQLFARHELCVVDVLRLDLHGGSLRITVARGGQPSSAVMKLLSDEEAAGVTRLDYFATFSSDVRRLGGRLVDLLQTLRKEGRRVAAYGASAKGTTLLNYCGIGVDTIEFVVDRSPIKQGLFTPGTHLPILPPSALLDRRPEYCLLLSWNFADEVLEQQREYRKGGGSFILPVPVPQVI